MDRETNSGFGGGEEDAKSCMTRWRARMVCCVLFEVAGEFEHNGTVGYFATHWLELLAVDVLDDGAIEGLVGPRSRRPVIVGHGRQRVLDDVLRCRGQLCPLCHLLVIRLAVIVALRLSGLLALGAGRRLLAARRHFTTGNHEQTQTNHFTCVTHRSVYIIIPFAPPPFQQCKRSRRQFVVPNPHKTTVKYHFLVTEQAAQGN